MTWRPEGWIGNTQEIVPLSYRGRYRIAFEAGADAMLEKVCEEIEKVENPYKEDFPRGHSPATYRIRRARRASFEDCRQKILSLLRKG